MFSVTLTKKHRTQLRKIARTTNQFCDPVSVVIIGGNQQPILTGEGFSWKTRGGRTIYHPNSYAKRGWSNMVYSPSTRRVEVGIEWLVQSLLNSPKNQIESL